MTVTPTFFETPVRFRRWLERNHDAANELWVGFYKVKSGKGGMVYRQALDEALCFGWIDGLVRSLDEESYAQRFTPRRKGSNWSAANIERVRQLEALGRMRQPGLAAFERRDEEKSAAYSFEQKAVKLAGGLEKAFRENSRAWIFFTAQPPSYRRAATWWVMSAKKEETRARRLSRLIAACAEGKRMT
jgi:uncharacterized protein YdeI (YjbR/CyaY-like superfamily)